MTKISVRPVDRETSRMELKQRLVSLAREVGFDSCRIAACGVAPNADKFRNWLHAGGHGEMSYMERGEEKRCDPQKVLADARSIVVLAINYFQGEQLRRSSRHVGITGRIARYAWGDDYHGLIETKLHSIDNFLREFGGQQKCYVDTGPVLERDQAARAGTGWHGKSTMLIDERLGTWFFLAEILTTLELPPDDPVPDRCGTCERCIKACPTGAITAPHHLDARRCISYLTIELKGSIPLELRPLIGNRIFGCDDCLDACPWNRFAQVSREAAFFARPSTMDIPLRDYLNLSDDDFRLIFRNSPIKRIKRRGFLRNVCVALGNVGDPSDLAALERAAADLEPLIAEHAKWAIHQIRSRHRISLSYLGTRKTSSGATAIN
jgi:epoxyqueuosine reductase